MVQKIMVDSFTKLELNYTGSLLVKGVGHIRCPTTNDIVEAGGEDVYNWRIGMLLYTKSQLADNLNIELTPDIVEELNSTPLFLFLVAQQDFRNAITEALSFFLDERLVFDEPSASFLTLRPGADDIVGNINCSNYEQVRDLILQRNYMSPPKEGAVKKKSKKELEREAKIAAGRKRSKKYKDRQDAMRLDNVTSKLAARSYSMNIQDVYNLTVYQLYDQFNEINMSLQIDTILTRWSVWGKDDFDFSVWCRPNE